MRGRGCAPRPPPPRPSPPESNPDASRAHAACVHTIVVQNPHLLGAERSAVGQKRGGKKLARIGFPPLVAFAAGSPVTFTVHTLPHAVHWSSVHILPPQKEVEGGGGRSESGHEKTSGDRAPRASPRLPRVPPRSGQRGLHGRDAHWSVTRTQLESGQNCEGGVEPGAEGNGSDEAPVAPHLCDLQKYVPCLRGLFHLTSRSTSSLMSTRC